MSITPTVHARGQPRLDAVLDLVAFAARPCPLITSLDELPRRIGEIFQADVCSIYLLEGNDLVMRGNVGFPAAALGEVRLLVGEGITGLTVECMRPISLDVATSHQRYRHFPGIGEEQFPIFLAVPVAGHDGPLGALVLQRREPPPFSAADIELACALTAPIAAAAERARLSEAIRGQRGTTGGGTRRVTLSGRPAVPGRAMGPGYALRRPASRPPPEPARSGNEVAQSLQQAIVRAGRAVQAADRRARELGLDGAFLDQARTILEDARLRERVLERAGAGQGLAQALVSVGSEAARSGAISGDAYALDRAHDVGDVCEALAMLAAPDRRASIPRGAVLLADHLTLFDLIVSSPVSGLYAGPSAVVLSERSPGPVSKVLLSLLGVPAVVDVTRLFSWVTDGDVLLVDGDHGIVRLNPSRAEVQMVRLGMRRTPEEPPAKP